MSKSERQRASKRGRRIKGRGAEKKENERANERESEKAKAREKGEKIQIESKRQGCRSER